MICFKANFLLRTVKYYLPHVFPWCPCCRRRPFTSSYVSCPCSKRRHFPLLSHGVPDAREDFVLPPIFTSPEEEKALTLFFLLSLHVPYQEKTFLFLLCFHGVLIATEDFAVPPIFPSPLQEKIYFCSHFRPSSFSCFSHGGIKLSLFSPWVKKAAYVSLYDKLKT